MMRPSKRQIAFAIAVVKTKPENLTVRDYITLLRKHIAKSRRDTPLQQLHRHLDKSSFWKAEYEKTIDTLTKAEAEVTYLRRDVDSLNAELKDAKSRVSPAKKRKKADGDVIYAPRSPKRSKRDASPSKSARPNPAVIIEETYDFVEAGETGNILMRSLYHVHVHFESLHVDHAGLAYHLIRAASALPQVVQAALKHSSVVAPDEGELERMLAAATCVFLVLIHGLEKLAVGSDGIEVQGSAIYSYIQSFGALLDLFEAAAMGEARRAAVLELNTAISAKVVKGKSKAKQPKPVNIKENSTLNLLTNFLCSILNLPKSDAKVHTALLEGFTYKILTKLGSKLYILTFGDARGDTIADEIAATNQPDDIVDDEQPTPGPVADLEKRAVKLAAPYLIHLLSRAMSHAQSHFGSLTSTRTGKPKIASYRGSLKGALAIHAKERLQRTLINCMFGEEGMRTDDEFMDCIKAPAMNGPPLPTPKVQDVEVQDWFREEVWRLLGWEILARGDTF